MDDTHTTRYKSTTTPKYKQENSSKYTDKRRTEGKYRKSHSRKYPNRDNNEMQWSGDYPICLFCKKKGHIKRNCAEMRLRENSLRHKNGKNRNFL